MRSAAVHAYAPPGPTDGPDDRDGRHLLRIGACVPYRSGYRRVIACAGLLNLGSALVALALAAFGNGAGEHVAVAVGGCADAVVFAAVWLRMRLPALEVRDTVLIWRRAVFADRVVALRDIVCVERQGRGLRIERRAGGALVVPLVFLEPAAVGEMVR